MKTEQLPKSNLGSWVVLLSDERQPAAMWKIVEETAEHYTLEYGNIKNLRITQEKSECWVVA